MDYFGEIKAAAFNQQAEDYVNLLQLNKVHYISKSTVMAEKASLLLVERAVCSWIIFWF